MKKIALMTFGLLLAAAPAFADTLVQQDSTANNLGNAYNNGNDWINNLGIGNSDISNSSGIVSEGLNTGAASNVGSATDVAISGGLVQQGNSTWVGSANDTDRQISYATLQQISAHNRVGNSYGVGASDPQNAGISNVGVNGSTGIITQQINTGIASNVGSAVGVTIR